MVWKDTERLGCGVSGSYLTCRYHPPGNFRGRFRENVLPLVEGGGSTPSPPSPPTPAPTPDPPAPPAPVPEDIQEILGQYANFLEGSNSQCGYNEAEPLSYFGGRLNGLRVTCPAASGRSNKFYYSVMQCQLLNLFLCSNFIDASKNPKTSFYLCDIK